MSPGDEGSGAEGRSEGDRERGNHGERRRYRRFRLEQSVNVHLGGRPEPVTVEIVDIAARGVRFRSPAGASLDSSTGLVVTDGRAGTPAVRILDEASFGFVSRDQHICVAHGRILRVAGAGDAERGAAPQAGDKDSGSGDELKPDPGAPGEFVVSVERANAAFHSFLASLAA